MKAIREFIEGDIKSGYINQIWNEDHSLFILNYSKKTEYENMWDGVTDICRGIVLDRDWNVIARPFCKFFNDFEIVRMGYNIPNIPFTAYEKYDGSLGIAFYNPYTECWMMTTRGSFNSEQARHGLDVLLSRYDVNKLSKDKTYLFEIIYPENHICVSYGETDDIILLAIIDSETGNEESIDAYRDDFNVAKTYDWTDLNTIREAFSDYNREGFVIRFENGVRMKVKYDTYFELHRLMSNISLKKVFEAIMINHVDYSEIVKDLDAENRKIVDDYKNTISNTTNDLMLDVDLAMYDDRFNLSSDKEAAEYIKSCGDIAPILFNIRKNKSIDDVIVRVVAKRLGL